MSSRGIPLVLGLLLALAGSGSANRVDATLSQVRQPVTGEGPVKVFILAGQSNMEGHGQIRSLDHLGDHPQYGYLLKLLKDAGGSWVVRNDVTISYQTERRKDQSGPLTVGWGASAREVGPELMLGVIMGEHYQEHVLLIKTAWGGKDVYCDFRSRRRLAD